MYPTFLGTILEKSLPNDPPTPTPKKSLFPNLFFWGGPGKVCKTEQSYPSQANISFLPSASGKKHNLFKVKSRMSHLNSKQRHECQIWFKLLIIIKTHIWVEQSRKCNVILSLSGSFVRILFIGFQFFSFNEDRCVGIHAQNEPLNVTIRRCGWGKSVAPRFVKDGRFVGVQREESWVSDCPRKFPFGLIKVWLGLGWGRDSEPCCQWFVRVFFFPYCNYFWPFVLLAVFSFPRRRKMSTMAAWSSFVKIDFKSQKWKNPRSHSQFDTVVVWQKKNVVCFTSFFLWIFIIFQKSHLTIMILSFPMELNPPQQVLINQILETILIKIEEIDNLTLDCLWN